MTASLLGNVPIQMGQAYWNGENLVFREKSDMCATDSSISGTTVFYEPIVPRCYGHALLDGCFTLFTILKQNNLLYNNEVTLFLVIEESFLNNSTVINMLDLIKTCFHFKEVFVQHKDKLKNKTIFFQNVIFNNWRANGFYVALPESYLYMHKLREFGWRENIIYRDPLPYPTLLDEFIEFIYAGYQIDPKEWPLLERSVIITTRKKNRIILNLEELESELKNAGYKVSNIDFESLSIKQQITHVLQSEFLIGTYGSNLVNAIFQRPTGKAVVVWPKHGKFFISRSWDIIYSAFLSRGITLVEYDKPDYDQKDQYTDDRPYPSEWFYRDGNVLKLYPSITLDEIFERPHPLFFHLFFVNLYINPGELIDQLGRL